MANFDIALDRLRCEKTTEPGHDEFFYPYSVTLFDANGVALPNPASGRGPSNAQKADADPVGAEHTAYDMNDSGGLEDRQFNQTLWTGSVPAGHRAKVFLSFMESDNTNVQQQVEAAAGLAKTIATKTGHDEIGWVADGVRILAGFIPTNEDDHLGAVGFTVECRADDSLWLIEETVAKDTTKSWAQSNDGQPPYTTELHLKGAGSNYFVFLRMDNVTKQAGSLLATTS